MLYATMRSELKLQLEMFMRIVLIPLCAAGKNKASTTANGASSNSSDGFNRETQRIALETVVDLCRQPHFVTDCYMHFDADSEQGVRV